MAVLSDAEIARLRPLTHATAWYFLLFYAFMMFQSFAKLYILATQKDKKSLREVKYESKKGLALMSDRTFLNMVEQCPPCLFSVWIYGLVVDPAKAANLLYAYIAFRAPYPLLYKKGPPFLFLSTLPNYLIIAYALYGAAMA